MRRDFADSRAPETARIFGEGQLEWGERDVAEKPQEGFSGILDHTVNRSWKGAWPRVHRPRDGS
jgi:hypothetical protein